MAITFTKNRQTGRFDIIGPVESMREGAVVSVSLKSGKSKSVTVGSVSKAFIAKFGPLQGRKCAIAKVGSSGYGPGSSEESWRNNGCSECRRLGDWCARCAFDEFDN